jgi:hypothetical protein
VKVAQHEVLGNDAQRHVRPGRDDRNARLLVSDAVQRLPAFRRSSHSSFVPPSLEERTRRPDYGGQAGTDSVLKTLNPLLRAGLLSSGPSGTDFLQPPTPCAILTSTS